MFCARCGQQIPDASEICPLCGREASLKIDSPPATSSTLTGAAAAPGQIQCPGEPKTIGPPIRQPDLKGVGGWLLFFCISITFLTPLIMLTSAVNSGFDAG